MSVRPGDLVIARPLSDQSVNFIRRCVRSGIYGRLQSAGVMFSWPRSDELGSLFLVLDDFCPEMVDFVSRNEIQDFRGLRWVKCLNRDGQVAIYDSRMFTPLVGDEEKV